MKYSKIVSKIMNPSQALLDRLQNELSALYRVTIPDKSKIDKINATRLSFEQEYKAFKKDMRRAIEDHTAWLAEFKKAKREELNQLSIKYIREEINIIKSKV